MLSDHIEARLKKGLNENFNSEDEDENGNMKILVEEEIIAAKNKGDGWLNPK